MNYNEAAMACFRIYPSICLKGMREITKNLRLVYLRIDKLSDFEKWKTVIKTNRELGWRKGFLHYHRIWLEEPRETWETFFQYCKHTEDNEAGTSHTVITLNTTSLATAFPNRSANSS
jgi:predicted RNA-binding protein with EMAP domain